MLESLKNVRLGYFKTKVLDNLKMPLTADDQQERLDAR